MKIPNVGNSYGTQLVRPITRHKPNGVTLQDPRKRPPRPSRQKQPEVGKMEELPLTTTAVVTDAQVSTGETEVIGGTVRKDYDGVEYNGTISRVDEFNEEQFYLVIYNDGNQEHIAFNEISAYMVT